MEIKLTEEKRYWEIWNKDRVERLEKEVWGEVNNHPRGRHYELMQYHVKLIPPDIKTILEVGCGMGHLYYEIREKYGYVGVDSSVAMVEKFKETFPESNVHLGDVFDLSPEPVSDCVVCEDVLMHLPDIVAPLHQLWSKVNVGGRLIVSMRMTEGDNPSWLIEREYVPMPDHFDILDPTKKLIIRASNHKEFEDILKSFKPIPKNFFEQFYDERTSIYVVDK